MQSIEYGRIPIDARELATTFMTDNIQPGLSPGTPTLTTLFLGAHDQLPRGSPILGLLWSTTRLTSEFLWDPKPPYPATYARRRFYQSSVDSSFTAWLNRPKPK
ncbi:hypothetical protein LguiA_005236 [Lonicera macranthoides]